MNTFVRAMFGAGAALAIASVASALKPESLEGEYQLAGPLDHKGSPGEGASHLYLSLKNSAARNLYRSLEVDPYEDPCTGYTVKARGNVACYEVRPNENYFCSFSIHLDRGTVEAGLGGCI